MAFCSGNADGLAPFCALDLVLFYLFFEGGLIRCS